MAQFLIFALLFILGASVGSFLNVLISRSIEGEQWKTGRSHCDNCGKILSWYDMIPVISYAIYRGKSRCCHKMLSIQHPVVETLTGMLFVWWFFVGSFFFRLVAHPFSTIQPLYWLFLGVILTGIFVTDLFYGLIPTLFVGIGVIITLGYRLLLATAGVYQWIDLGESLLTASGAWLFFYFLRWITKEKGMGDGDVVLAFLLGLILGWPKTPVGILLSFVIGAAVSVFLLAIKSKKMKSTVPFGPFMIIGAVTALMWGNQIIKMIGF